jgi:predicted PurR-regulated permease PerM
MQVMQPQIGRRVQILLSLLILVAATYLIGITWVFVSQFLGTLLIFFLAWLLAYLLKPLVLRITRSGLPFGVAVVLVYIIVPALLLLAGYLLIPAITEQGAQISSHLDEYTSKISGLLDSVKSVLTSLGVTQSDLQQVENKVREAAGSAGQFVLAGGVGAVGGIANEVFHISLVLIFSVSFLVDGDELASKGLAAMPERWREGANLIVEAVETSFGTFVRGQLLAALAYALLTAGTMLAFGLPNVAVASMLAGLFIIMPLVGNYLAYLPPVLVCMVARPDQVLIVFVVLAIVQGIYLNVVSPSIMAKAVKMHPLVTTASILIFGQIGGFWGAVFGIPIASTIGMLARPTMQLVLDYLNLSTDADSQAVTQLPATPATPAALAAPTTNVVQPAVAVTERATQPPLP